MIETMESQQIQSLQIEERIAYYERELQRLTPAKTFREQVLCNVYRSLLESCIEQISMPSSTQGGERDHRRTH